MIKSLKEYIEALQKHDWYYEYSDDYRVYNQGRLELKRITEGFEEFDPDLKLFKEYAPKR